MPPVVPRKRLREASDSDSPSLQKDTKKAIQRKPTLYDDLDAATSSNPSNNSKPLLRGHGADDSESSLSSLSDSDFEDVPVPTKRQKVQDSGGDVDDDDDSIEFEDVQAPPTNVSSAPVLTGDLQLNLSLDHQVDFTDPYGTKKGPSKRERAVRNATHQLHVMTLLWHNAIRNAWLCDQEVQATMLSHLPRWLWSEVDRWRAKSGLHEPSPSPKGKGRKKGKGSKAATDRASRDWNADARKLDKGQADISHGDPLFRLMQSLASWWKQRYRVTAPGLRKRGYMSIDKLSEIRASYADGHFDPDTFGEKVSNLEHLRLLARICRGSRDVGAQLFTALLRGLGLEARMVANLQTVGFTFTKLEDAESETKEVVSRPQKIQVSSSKAPGATKPTGSKSKASGSRRSARHTHSGKDGEMTMIDSSDDLKVDYEDTDDESLVEVQLTPKKTGNSTKKFDQDLEYPHYWTEVLSPVTNRYLPVDAVVKHVVATNRDLVESLEPRGGKADKSRQVMAYIIGYSPDGTAKDVTVRYLRKQIAPGRTKSTRYPISKIPIYNRHGKVARYEKLDWFKMAMSGYVRGSKQAPLTETDQLEDETDLKPAQPQKKEVLVGEETLQYYKQSKEFVLERHLKREEALKPGAKPVKVFKAKSKGETSEEDVYLRADVVGVKSPETWHKQGRAPKPDEEPLKRVPYRVATTNRRREIAEIEALTGRKALQGLYSREQTDWIIPPPIKDGIIPKNDYGNIDLFVEHMCPEGAIHVPYRSAMRVCKRMGIDYAEAVVGFEFGHRMAVPVIQGVVIAEEQYEGLMVELEKEEAERQRKEDEKRRKVAIDKWRKFLMGMRIVERIKQDYGHISNNVTVFGPGRDNKLALDTAEDKPNEDMAGGFLPEGYEQEEEDGPAYHKSSFFPARADEDDTEDNDIDGMILEHQHDQEPKTEPREIPILEQDRGGGSGKVKGKAKATTHKAESHRGEERATARRPQRFTRNRKMAISEEDEHLSTGDEENM
ncbi:hypothetical protein N3K66_000383 [Trichothecium roseum]|uniref:Uncharacterized protein n=1 Tax=Trichothecium roseum TaxID=47278 RepID=A0ACC0VCD2_9HYPO|nr:hypothetical protein N3K66_000383 [Trichothecium roseum]